MCVCVCVCACVRACVRVFTCVWGSIHAYMYPSGAGVGVSGAAGEDEKVKGKKLWRKEQREGYAQEQV